MNMQHFFSQLAYVVSLSLMLALGATPASAKDPSIFALANASSEINIALLNGYHTTASTRNDPSLARLDWPVDVGVRNDPSLARLDWPVDVGKQSQYWR